MTQAEELIKEFESFPCTTVSGAIYLAMFDSKESTEYTDSKGCFMHMILTYADGSRLRIHRNGKTEYRKTGKVIASLNLYTHKEPSK